MQCAARHKLWFILIVAVMLNLASWLSVRKISTKWLNVPEVPALNTAIGFGLGDAQLAYRQIGIMIQNLGDTGGRSTPLKAYNYDRLGQWFFLVDKLDPKSHFMPFIAAYYFANVDDSQKLSNVVDYLAVVGQRPGQERWRWLAQAVYIARWQMKDLDKALALSKILASLNEPDLPLWTKQMPAFVLNAKGNKEEAAAVMMEILKSSVDKIHPNEVNHTKDYICTRILTEKEAEKTSLCQNIP